MAGIRLGYLAAAAHWVEQFEKVRPPYNVSSLDEAAAEFALEHITVLAGQATQIRAERERFSLELASLPGVTVFPSRANFVLIRVPEGPSIVAGLRERGLLVKNVSAMHPLLANCLRITVGTPAEQVQLIEALRATLAAGAC